MMDISDIIRGPVVAREGPRIDFELKVGEAGEETLDDEKCSRNLKRSLDKDVMTSKKRRKQLKPIKIATNLDNMVKVPKQILDLNNDLANVNDLSRTVPKEINSKSRNSPLLTDVHPTNPPQSETSAGQNLNDTIKTIDSCQATEIAENADVNVPNIEMGPNYMTSPHFIFPLPFQSVKNANFWSEANLKIFNQEAYCEVCKKEFCNKYFLKTHKANKHGIYMDVPASGGAKAQTKAEGKDVSKMNENGRIPGNGDCATSFCDLCNKKFCNKYFVRRHKNKSHGFVEEEAQGSLSHETECKVVQNISNHSTKEADSTLTSREPLALVSKENDKEKDNQQRGKSDSESPLNLIVNAKDVGEEREEETEGPEEVSGNESDDCSNENIEKLQTMLLRLNPSEIDGKPCKACNKPLDGSGEHKCFADRKDRDLCSESNDSSNDSKSEFGAPKMGTLDYAYMNKLDHLKQTKPTSSYCEICNKELCNKYFMRTHMQRMHGIEIEHGTQIGGVVCNICNKELCSKYFLRVHKQNTHGIMSPNSLLAPSTSGNVPHPRTDIKTSRTDSRFPNFTQVCYICNKRFRNPKWLQAHFLSDHRDAPVGTESKDFPECDPKQEESILNVPRNNNSALSVDCNEPSESLDVISKIFWENNASSKLYNCSQCPFTTTVLAFLFVHERSHYVLPQDHSEIIRPSVSLQNLIQNKTFWQHKITQQIPECLDLSAGDPKCLSFQQNGS